MQIASQPASTTQTYTLPDCPQYVGLGTIDNVTSVTLQVNGRVVFSVNANNLLDAIANPGSLGVSGSVLWVSDGKYAGERSYLTIVTNAGVGGSTVSVDSLDSGSLEQSGRLVTVVEQVLANRTTTFQDCHHIALVGIDMSDTTVSIVRKNGFSDTLSLGMLQYMHSQAYPVSAATPGIPMSYAGISRVLIQNGATAFNAVTIRFGFEG